MNDDESAELTRFRRTLEQQNREFIYTVPALDDCAQVRFLGRFDKRPVLWDATIMTLGHYHAKHGSQEIANRERQFIEIDDTAGDIRRIRIGLQLDHIDEPVILKTIIMVRNYKRLHTGRHEFAYRSLRR